MFWFSSEPESSFAWLFLLVIIHHLVCFFATLFNDRYYPVSSNPHGCSWCHCIRACPQVYEPIGYLVASDLSVPWYSEETKPISSCHTLRSLFAFLD